MIKKTAILLLALLIPTGLGLAVHHYMTTPSTPGVCKLKTVSSVPYLHKDDIVNFYWTSKRNPDIPDISEGLAPVKGRKILFSVPFKHRDLNGCLFDQGQNGYTIYADLNNDGSLADETPVVSHKQTYDDEDFLFLFGPLSLTDNTETPPFYLFLSNFTAGIHIGPTTIKKGKIKLNGSIHDLMLADLDFDGRYKTHFSPECMKGKGLLNPALCDKLLFDFDGDKEFTTRYFLESELLHLPKLIRLEKQYYSVEVTDNELTALPSTPQTGTLRLNTQQSSFELYSDTYPCIIDYVNTVELPAGNYSVLRDFNFIQDKDGNIWNWCSIPNSGPIANFAIVPDQETTLEIPLSFTLKTSVDYKKGKCRVRIRLFSDNNKEYVPIFQKNEKQTREPTLTILDENNKAIHTGQMEYG